ncbi:MAG: ABA4-like family protein [Vicinamibacterales bacterium]
MTPEQVFSFASTTAAVTWLALAVRPRARAVQLLAGTVVPIGFALVYAAIIAVRFGRGEGGFGSLADVAALFQDPWTLLAGWIHYLAFDLLTGVWETRDAAARGIPHWMVVPCLFLTFMFGPAGWLLYRGVRLVGPGRGQA